MQMMVNRAVRASAMLGYIDGERVSIALTRTDADGDFQQSVHGVYWPKSEAYAVAQNFVDRLNDIARTRGWFNIDDITPALRRAELAVRGC
jgi:hypothetical protein